MHGGFAADASGHAEILINPSFANACACVTSTRRRVWSSRQRLRSPRRALPLQLDAPGRLRSARVSRCGDTSREATQAHSLPATQTETPPGRRAPGCRHEDLRRGCTREQSRTYPGGHLEYIVVAEDQPVPGRQTDQAHTPLATGGQSRRRFVHPRKARQACSRTPSRSRASRTRTAGAIRKSRRAPETCRHRADPSCPLSPHSLAGREESGSIPAPGAEPVGMAGSPTCGYWVRVDGFSAVGKSPGTRKPRCAGSSDAYDNHGTPHRHSFLARGCALRPDRRGLIATARRSPRLPALARLPRHKVVSLLGRQPQLTGAGPVLWRDPFRASPALLLRHPRSLRPRAQAFAYS